MILMHFLRTHDTFGPKMTANETFMQFLCYHLLTNQDRPHKVYIFWKLGACILFWVYLVRLLNYSIKSGQTSRSLSFSWWRYHVSLNICCVKLLPSRGHYNYVIIRGRVWHEICLAKPTHIAWGGRPRAIPYSNSTEHCGVPKQVIWFGIRQVQARFLKTFSDLATQSRVRYE